MRVARWRLAWRGTVVELAISRHRSGTVATHPLLRIIALNAEPPDVPALLRAPEKLACRGKEVPDPLDGIGRNGDGVCCMMAYWRVGGGTLCAVAWCDGQLRLRQEDQSTSMDGLCGNRSDEQCAWDVGGES